MAHHVANLGERHHAFGIIKQENGPDEYRRAPCHFMHNITGIIEQSFRQDWGPSVAYMLRLSGDLAIAEECVQSAFESALKSWSKSVPDNPGAWIRKSARNRFIDSIRAAKTKDAAEAALTRMEEMREAGNSGEKSVLDDELALIFLCCHPAISPTDQVMLVLRLIGGLKPAEIACAFMSKEEAIRSRLLRAKRKMRAAKISTTMPAKKDLSNRISQVLAAIYLIYNEAYRASRNAADDRLDLALEAIRLSGRFCRIMPNHFEVHGLMALILLGEARRPARFHKNALIPLEAQDRAKWDQNLIKAGSHHLVIAQELRGSQDNNQGIYTIQAEIAVTHVNAANFEATDWQKITMHYDALLEIQQNPIFELNRIAAQSYISDKDMALKALEVWELENEISSQTLALKADIFRRAGDVKAAATVYQQAFEIEKDDAIIEFMKTRLAGLQ